MKTRKTTPALAILFIMMLVLAGTTSAQDAATPEELCDAAIPAANPDVSEYTETEFVLEEGADYRAIFCTNAGPVYVDLFERLAPVTVNNFVFLSQNGYYNNTTFHRVLENFMAQGGDPTATGMGGPGYQFQDELVGFLMFDRVGLLAMANAGPGTNGSQFFLTTAVVDYLNYQHTIYGEVLTGQDNVEGITLRDPQSATEPGTAINTILIIADPSTVDAQYDVPVRATEEDFRFNLNELPADIGIDGVLRNGEMSGIFDASTMAMFAPAELSADYEAFLSDNNHQYSVLSTYYNSECDFEVLPLDEFSYTIHVFATEEDALAAAEDDFFPTLANDGHDSRVTAGVLSALPVNIWADALCDGEAGTQARMIRQLGRFVIITDTRYPSDSPLVIEEWIDGLSFQFYESVFLTALRNEVVR